MMKTYCFCYEVIQTVVEDSRVVALYLFKTEEDLKMVHDE